MRCMLWKTSAAIITLLNLLMMLSGAAAAEPTYVVAFGDSRPHFIIVQRFVDGRVDLYGAISETNNTTEEIAPLRAFLNGTG